MPFFVVASAIIEILGAFGCSFQNWPTSLLSLLPGGNENMISPLRFEHHEHERLFLEFFQIEISARHDRIEM